MSRDNYYKRSSRRGKTHKTRNNIVFVIIIFIIIIGIFWLLSSFGVFKNDKPIETTKLVLTETASPTAEKIEVSPTIIPVLETPTLEVKATPAPTIPKIGYVDTDELDGSVRVRANASDDGDVLGSIKNRETLYILDKQDDYYNINFKKASAFIHEDYVTEGLPQDNRLRDVVTGEIRETIFVNIADILPDAKIELPFVTSDNFANTQLYPFELALMQSTSAQKLKIAQELFLADGYTIVIWDVYRPYSVSKEIYDIFKDPKLVADPSLGSKHNRGVAIDMTLYNLNTDEYVDMPTTSRVMDTSIVNRKSNKMTATQRANMEYMTKIMERAGFTPYTGEWWHYNDADWENYPVLDIQFKAWS